MEKELRAQVRAADNAFPFSTVCSPRPHCPTLRTHGLMHFTDIPQVLRGEIIHAVVPHLVVRTQLDPNTAACLIPTALTCRAWLECVRLLNQAWKHISLTHQTQKEASCTSNRMFHPGIVPLSYLRPQLLNRFTGRGICRSCVYQGDVSWLPCVESRYFEFIPQTYAKGYFPDRTLSARVVIGGAQNGDAFWTCCSSTSQQCQGGLNTPGCKHQSTGFDEYDTSRDEHEKYAIETEEYVQQMNGGRIPPEYFQPRQNTSRIIQEFLSKYSRN